MDVTLLYFDGCPNWKVADERLQLLATERPDITIHHQLVESAEEAVQLRFFGSPSIRMDGVDLFVEPDASVGLTCRRYPTPTGYAGAPTLEQLRTVVELRERDTAAEPVCEEDNS
ncbi:thioredoxin family protein [Microbacterium sp. NPDC076768]|uniref:thioredoxin family protein n=1 Tax=Microbacterium sp. NPDC076768 TaxID=3154858 RepID=UPI00343DDBF9